MLCRLAVTESCLFAEALRRHPGAILPVVSENADAPGRRHANLGPSAHAPRPAPRTPLIRGLLPMGRRRSAPSCGRLPLARLSTRRTAGRATPCPPALSQKRLCRRACGSGASPAGGRTGLGGADAATGPGAGTRRIRAEIAQDSRAIAPQKGATACTSACAQQQVWRRSAATCVLSVLLILTCSRPAASDVQTCQAHSGLTVEGEHSHSGRQTAGWLTIAGSTPGDRQDDGQRASTITLCVTRTVGPLGSRQHAPAVTGAPGRRTRRGRPEDYGNLYSAPISTYLR